MPSVLSKLAETTASLEAKLVTPLQSKTLTFELVEDCLTEQMRVSHQAARLFEQKQTHQALTLWCTLTRSLLQLYARLDECTEFMTDAAIGDVKLNLYNIMLNLVECRHTLQRFDESLVDLLLYAQQLYPEKPDAHQFLAQIWMESPDPKEHQQMTTLLEHLVFNRENPECREFAGTLLVMLTVNQKYQPASLQYYEDLLKIADPDNVAIVLAQAKHDRSGRNDHDILRRYRVLLKRPDLTASERAITHQHRALLMLNSKKSYPITDVISDLRHYYDHTQKPNDLLFLAMILLQNSSHIPANVAEGMAHLRALAQQGHGSACIVLGKIILYGQHEITQNDTEGLALIQQALSAHATQTEPLEVCDTSYYSFGYYTFGQYLKKQLGSLDHETEEAIATIEATLVSMSELPQDQQKSALNAAIVASLPEGPGSEAAVDAAISTLTELPTEEQDKAHILLEIAQAAQIEHCYQTAHQLGNPYASLIIARNNIVKGQYDEAISILNSLTRKTTPQAEGEFRVNINFAKRYDCTGIYKQAHFQLGKCYERKSTNEPAADSLRNSELAKKNYSIAIKLGFIPAVVEYLRCILKSEGEKTSRELRELKRLVLTHFDTKIISEHAELIQCIEVIESHEYGEQEAQFSQDKATTPHPTPKRAHAERAKEPRSLKPTTEVAAPAQAVKQAVQLVRPRSPTQLESLEEIAHKPDLSNVKKVHRICAQLERGKDTMDAHTKSSSVRLIGALMDKSHYVSTSSIMSTLDTLTALFDEGELADLNQWHLLDIFNGLKKMKVSPDHPKLTRWIKPLSDQIRLLIAANRITPKATLYLFNALTGLLPCRDPELMNALRELIGLNATHPLFHDHSNSILVHSLALCHYGDPTLFDPRSFDPLIQQVVRESQKQTDERSQTQALLGLSYFSPFYQKTALFDTVNGAVEQLVQARASSAHTKVTASRLQVDVTQHLQHLIRRHKVTLVEEHVIAGLPVDCWIERYRTVENLVFQINGPCHYLLTQDHTGKEHYIPHVTSQFNHDHLTRAGCTVVELSFEKVPHTPELMMEQWDATWLQEKIQLAHSERDSKPASPKAASSTAKAGLFSAARSVSPPTDGAVESPAPSSIDKNQP